MRTLYNASADAITTKQSIVGQESKRFGKALGNQQPIERVSMDKGKLCDASRVGCGYGQLDQAHLRQYGQQTGKVDAKIFAPQRALDRDFPDARRTVIDVVAVVLQKLARFAWQASAARRRPQ